MNTKVLLDIIRRQQPLSRADLSRKSGLQPSTVSLIVDELIASGWVLEGENSKSARGRRPTMLSLNPQRCVIAVDIHPSQVTLAVIQIGGHIASQRLLNLPDDPSQAIRSMTAALRKLIRANRELVFEGIGICLPGRTDISARQLIFAPNLHWPAVSLQPRIERATGLPVFMDNVANACALSEVWFRTSSDMRDFVVVAISEGIGTGIFINGAIARGQAGMAGEFGHVQIADDGPLCNCGNRGCWETFASTRAALRFYRELSHRRARITFSELLRLATINDGAATEALQRMARSLGHGMSIVAAALAPSEIIVVGEITQIWGQLGPVIESSMQRNSLARNVPVRPAPDSATARLRSAVALVLADHPLAGALKQ